MSDRKPVIQVNVRMPLELRDRLEEHLTATGGKLQDFVNEAVDQKLRRHRR